MQLNLFKEICFLPLDIPPLPDKSDICNQFDQLTSERYIWWNREILLGKKDYEHPIGSYDCTWSDIARSRFSQIIKSIETSLPFENLYYCHLARAQEEILPHVDENYIEKPFPFHMSILPELKKHLEENEPIGFRFLVQGRRDALYVCKDYDPEYKITTKQKLHYCQLPEETDFFLIRNGQVPHGVNIEPHQPRLVGFILGSVNQKFHQELIERSYEKFHKYVILKKHIWEAESTI